MWLNHGTIKTFWPGVAAIANLWHSYIDEKFETYNADLGAVSTIHIQYFLKETTGSGGN